MIYREATKADLADIARLGELFYNESGYSEYADYKYSSIFETLNFLLTSLMGLLVVAEEEKIVGIAGVILFPLYYNHDYLCGQELCWWVDKEYKNMGIGKELVLYLEKKAREKGCKALSVGTTESFHPEAVGRMYEHNGYKKHETIYIKRL